VSSSGRLSDLGERRIIREILGARYGHRDGFGDDCAWVPALEVNVTDKLLVTTDPCPEPAAGIAGFADEYYRGWLLATINLSDVAAAGAQPLGMVTSLVLPASMPVADFERLLDGIDACCAEVGTSVIGGNLKEGSKIDITATAFGLCVGGSPLSRSGARPGDVVALVGDIGLFWAGLGCILAKVEIPVEYQQILMKNVLTPLPMLAAGMALRSSQLVTSCMDNSDGLYPSMETLGAANEVGVDLDFGSVVWMPAVRWAADALQVDAVRFALGWGDWQLVITYPPEHAARLADLMEAQGVALTSIGTIASQRGTRILHGGHFGELSPIDSQRFASDSWFTTGIGAYEDSLLRASLFRLQS